MALPLSIQYTIKDDKGFSSRTLIRVPSTTSLANATTFAGDFAQVIDALINGQIVSVELCVGIDISGLTLKDTPVANTDVEEGAVFTFADALGLLFRQRLPTFKEDFVLAHSRNIDVDSDEVSAYVALVTTGNGTVSPTTQSGSDLTALTSSKEQFVKNRKGRTR